MQIYSTGDSYLVRIAGNRNVLGHSYNVKQTNLNYYILSIFCKGMSNPNIYYVGLPEERHTVKIQ